MKKNVLVVGSGGREHALAWKLRQSSEVGDLFIASGNAGTATVGQNIPIKPTDIAGLLDFADKKDIDLTVVGPDDPLAMGIVDAFEDEGLNIFGPLRAAAQIESSKAFAKALMTEAKVPTAPYELFTDAAHAIEHVRKHFEKTNAPPIVLKASGLALGKGAYVCRTLTEAEQAVDEIMIQRVHGSAGDEMVVENYLGGPEVSIHAFVDGRSCKLFPAAQDHKPIFDGDQGPNTGGMGTICPLPWFNQQEVVGKRIVEPIVQALLRGDKPFTGCLYPGIKMTGWGPMVLEYNARFGDPETQVFMRLLETDLVEIIEACIDGRLDEIDINWKPSYAACVVMASDGYPSPNYRKGLPITGIEEAEMKPEVVVFHAGTSNSDGALRTSGGRVLGVTAIGNTPKEAIDRAYAGVGCIDFAGKQFRTDIGAKSLAMPAK